jgi:hypothetical protein
VKHVDVSIDLPDELRARAEAFAAAAGISLEALVTQAVREALRARGVEAADADGGGPQPGIDPP